MEKIKNWFIKHKKVIDSIVSIIVTLSIFLAGVVIGQRTSCDLTASADVYASYLPPAVSCQYKFDNNTEQFPIYAPLYPNTLQIADHYVYFNSVNYWFYPQIYLTQGSNYIELTANPDTEGILFSSFTLWFTDWVTDRVNNHHPLVYVYSSYGDQDMYYAVDVYNPSTSVFDRLTGFIDGVYIEADDKYDYTLILSLPESYFLDGSDCVYIRSVQLTQTLYSSSVGSTTTQHSFSCGFTSTEKSIVNDYYSSLSSSTIVETRWDILGSIVDSVDSFLETEILPDFSFYDILVIALAIPLLIAVLKLWLGG